MPSEKGRTTGVPDMPRRFLNAAEIQPDIKSHKTSSKNCFCLRTMGTRN
jgi:hypothetical protein